MPRFLTAVLILFLVAASHAQVEERVTLQFPNGQISDIANYYEVLTGKTLIRDAAAAGSPVPIFAPNPIPKDEAIALIESALLLNGYVIVDVDEKTAKLLGQSKSPKSEAIPLYTDAAMLPDNEEVVSYFMPLRYIKAENAATFFLTQVQPHPFGSIQPVPNINALVITENVPTIRRIVGLKNLIDVQGEKIITRTFPLQRADAEAVAEVLQKMFEPNQQSATTGAQGNAQPQQVPPQPGVPETVPAQIQQAAAASNFVAAQAPAVKVFPDKRTNRVLVVAAEDQMEYVETVINSLDEAVAFEEPFERPLRFVKAGDVLPVLAKLLAEGTDQKDATADLNVDNEVGRDTNQNAFGSNTSDNFGGSNSGYGGYGGTGSGTSVSLNTETVNIKPISVIVGNSRIIADTSLNKIIIFGTPEARSKVRKVLDLLDQRPKQVYLACVIGQLTLGDDIDFGIDYLMRFGDVRILGQGQMGTINNLIANRNAAIDLVPGTDNVVNTATDVATTAANVAQTALPVVSGLTVFGSIGNTVDVLARALASTNRFQIISRPMLFTANGQPARIASGQDVPFAGESLSNINNSVNANIGTTVTSTTQYRKAELELQIQPLINSNQEVTLRIAQKNDNLAGNSNITAGTTAPIFNTQVLNTVVTVPNRSTVIIGGLISDEDRRVQTGIPFLKDIPGLGYFFSSTQKTKTRRELIILIQPFIVDSEYAMEEVNRIERANTSFKEGLFDESLPVRPAELPTAEDWAAQVK